MIFYLKINRNEKYTFRNLQHWISCIELLSDSKYFIICDDEKLKEDVLEKVLFQKRDVEFLKSCKTSSRINNIISDITEDIWRNAGYAHMTTFWHAKENGYPFFWNIDADDTCICLSPERVCEMLLGVERYVKQNEISAMSLDMWNSRTWGYHWSFGITCIDNTCDWYEVIERYSKNEEVKSKQIKNIDGYFSCLKVCTELKIETFYFENLKFIHYSNDFFKRPDVSGFFHWKEGKLVLPILKYCYALDSVGELPIPEDNIKLDIGISDEETTEFLLNYAFPYEKERIKLRMSHALELSR